MIRAFQNARVYFGEFEADLESGELWHGEQRIQIEQKPFQILAALLERPGRLLSRQDLYQRIWPTVSHGDLGHSLNIAVAKLRCALSDSIENPKYIETLSQRGYRLIASVNGQGQPAPLRIYNEHRDVRIRIAVLPFENIPWTTEQDCFNDGLADAIISNLGQSDPGHLGVIARKSVMQFKGTILDIFHIGRRLEVDYILEGRIQRIADRLRINVQLVKVEDQTRVWGERYEFDYCDLLSLQDSVALKITGSLADHLIPQSAEHSIKSRDALSLYLKGRYYQSRETEVSLLRGIECFERAIQLDPHYALAYSGLADSKFALGLWGRGQGLPKDFCPQAKAAALRAIEINPKLSTCYTSLAWIKAGYDWDWAASEELLRRAVDLNPNDPGPHRVYRFILSYYERHEEAIREAEKSCELAPLSPGMHLTLGRAHYLARQYDQAIEAFQDALTIDETFEMAKIWLGNVYSQKSMFKEAILVLQSSETYNSHRLASLACVYARIGKVKEAYRILRKLTLIARRRYVPALDFALITSALGKTDQAFSWLNEAHREHSHVFPVTLQVDPRFDMLRNDPRYHDLIGRIR